MTQAIGAATGSPYLAAGGSDAGLRGQLARYEKELSACVNCDTADTLAGQQKIQELSNRIAQIKTRIEDAGAAEQIRRSAGTPAAVRGVNELGGLTISAPATTGAVPGIESGPPGLDGAGQRIGSRIDIRV